MPRENASMIKYFLFLLISSIISVVTLTIFEFGGWIIGDEWTKTYYYISLIGFPIDLLSMGVFIIIVIFVYSTVLSIVSLGNLSYLNPLKHYKLGRVFTVISEIIIAGILIFLVIMGIGANFWWVGVSSYEGLSSSFLNLVLYTIIIRKLNLKN